MKTKFLLLIIFSIFVLSACSPATVQPAPRSPQGEVEVTPTPFEMQVEATVVSVEVIVATPVIEFCVPVETQKAVGTDITIEAGRPVVADLAFPLVTGQDADRVTSAHHVRIDLAELPVTFTGAVGKIYFFSVECSANGIYNWSATNLTSESTMLWIWEYFGVKK